MKKVLFSIVSFLLLMVLFATSSTGCANIIPPSGGPRDTLPPVLEVATPKDSTTNFKGNRITLTFNEFVDLQDVQQNLLFTPTFENNPVIEARLRTLTIRLKDTLEPNTTYTFNFGNAIKDINEGNVLRDFTYRFSTGPHLDSLELTGKVLLAETGKIDTTLIVILHKSLDDSAVVKQRPRYVTRLDGQGNFRFGNLPSGTFAIYALGDQGGGRRYMGKSQLFAFANAPVVVSDTTKPVTLYAYSEVPAPPPGGATTTTGRTTDKRLRITTNLSDNQQDLLSNLVLTFERPLRLFDSTRVSLTRDSAFNRVTAFRTLLDSTRKQLTVQTAWQPDTYYNLLLDKDFAEDTLGRRLLRADTLSFTTRKQADYGSLSLRLRNLDTAQNPVLLFVQNDKVVFSTPIKSGRFDASLFLPGEYELRVLYDRNNNGKWDPGQFFGTKRQPELVRPIEQNIIVKPAWENEFERSL